MRLSIAVPPFSVAVASCSPHLRDVVALVPTLDIVSMMWYGHDPGWSYEYIRDVSEPLSDAQPVTLSLSIGSFLDITLDHEPRDNLRLEAVRLIDYPRTYGIPLLVPGSSGGRRVSLALLVALFQLRLLGTDQMVNSVLDEMLPP